MLTGVFLKNVKIYKRQRFIPVSTGDGFTAFVGPNGAGKSSVLEALDVYFNNSPWNVNKQARRVGETTNFINLPYICPVFLMPRADFDKLIDDAPARTLLEKASTYLWDHEKFPEKQPILKDFAGHVASLKERGLATTHLLVVGGIRFQLDDAPTYFGPFHQQAEFLKALGVTPSDAEPQLERSKQNDSKVQALGLGKLNTALREFYTYLYIPADISVAEYTKLETASMQALMGRDLDSEIGKAISPSILEKINKSLDDTVASATEGLSQYRYDKPIGGKKNITANTLSGLITKEYFSIRELSRVVGDNTIPVSSLSSGEQRRALIDLTANYLIKRKDLHSRTILAIDEPEISLHTSLCYDQFEDLFGVASHGTQTIVTTHWYGFLPIAQNGAAHFLAVDDDGETVKIDSYDLRNYREKATNRIKDSSGDLPFDISLKSANDLVQAIASSLRAATPYNWVLCEGSSEQIYLSYLLREEIARHHLRLLPLGGSGEVVKIYRYLEAALADRTFSGSGRVLALIDTDKEQINYKPQQKIRNLDFKRLLLKESDELVLLDVDAALVSPATDIEDCLDAPTFVTVLAGYGDAAVGFTIDAAHKRPDAKHSGRALDVRESERLKLDQFFAVKGRKVDFANRYVKAAKEASDVDTDLSQQICELLKLPAPPRPAPPPEGSS